MQLNLSTDYSLRVLIYLGSQKRPDEKLTIDDLVTAFHLSKNHLMKIVHNLAKHQLIHTTRGKGGGIVLNQMAKSKKLGDLVTLLESNLALVECMGQKSQCTIERGCVLKSALSGALEQFISSLNQFTLDDLLPPK